MFRLLAILCLTGLAACAGYASERSHEVTVITEPPGAGCTVERNGIRTRLIGGTPLTFVVTRDDALILWAHAGLVDPPEVVARTLARHENLWAEISIRGFEIAPGGVINPEWRALFERFPDRFMTGSDTYVTSQRDAYADIIDLHRTWLAQLPPDVGRAVAYGNAVRLFGSGGHAELER